MLTALEQGVMGGKWHSLIDKVYALPNLRRAIARVQANHGAAGVDHVTVEDFERHLQANLEKLSHALRGNGIRDGYPLFSGLRGSNSDFTNAIEKR
jgi:RNA-directed DNA polymerase